MVHLREEVEMAKAKSAVPEGYHTVTPQLTLDRGLERTAAWFIESGFAAERQGVGSG